MEQKKIDEIRVICENRKNWGGFDNAVLELVEYIYKLQEEISDNEIKELSLRNVIAYKDDEIEELKTEVAQMQKLYMKLLLQIENGG